MSKINVKYLGHFGSDLDVVNAARVSFAKERETLSLQDEKLIEYLATGLRSKERAILINKIINIGIDAISVVDDKTVADVAIDRASAIIDEIQNISKHWAPFTHCFVKFRLSIPIFVARQLHRSGVGFSPPLADEFGYSEESRRYIDNEPDLFMPDSWRERATDVKQGSGGNHPNQDMFNCVLTDTNDQAIERYNFLIMNDVSPEQARMVLPLSTMTNFVWTGSLYAWSNLCKQRLDNHAQQESQETAIAISAEMRKLFPVSWKALVRS